MNHILDESYKQALKVNWSEKYVLRKFWDFEAFMLFYYT